MRKGYPRSGTKRHVGNPEGQIFGYARVSTRDQKLDLQLDALERAGVPRANVYVETVSGSSRRRPQFELCMKALRPGDTLVVWKLDRLGRKALVILQRMQWFREHDITFKSLTEGVDFTTPIGEFFAMLLAASSQFEVRQTGVRTEAGIQAHRERGGRYGRRVSFNLKRAVEVLKTSGSLIAAAKAARVHRQTLWYHVKNDPELRALLKRRKK